MALSDVDRKRLDEAVTKAESFTSAEVVVVLRQASGSYADLSVGASLAAVLLGLVAILFIEAFELDPLFVVPVLLVAALPGGLVGWWLGPRLATTQRRAAQVDEAALAAFARCGVHRTKGRTGLLLYVSRGERQARLLPDQGVVDAVPAEVRAEWRAALAGLAADFQVAGLATFIEALGERVGRFLPRAADDVDELASMPEGASAVELS